MWENIDLPARRIRVRQQATGGSLGPLKTETSERDVVIHDILADQLKSHAAQTPSNSLGLVFAHKGNIISTTTLAYHVRQTVTRARIPHATIHDLRRTYGSILIAAGADITYIQHQLGHASPQVTFLHYARLWNERTNIDKVATYLEEVPVGRGAAAVAEAIPDHRQ
jgi:integrase